MLTDVRNIALPARVAPAIAATVLTFPVQVAVKTAVRPTSTSPPYIPYAIPAQARPELDALPCAYAASGSAIHVIATNPLIDSARC